MTKGLKRIDISAIPELLSIATEVRRTNEPRILKQDSEDLAILAPIKPPSTRNTRGKPVTKDDPLWNLVGIGHSGRDDISTNKHKYLAEAYLRHHKPS